MNAERMKQILMGLVTPVLLALPAIAVADRITFEDRVIDGPTLLASAQKEGVFQYQATVGASWEVEHTFGNPASALATFFNGQASVSGNILEIKLTGGGLFSFVSVDFLTLTPDNNDDVWITGSLGGNPAGTLSLDTPTFQFQTAPSGFSDSIDLLRIQVTTPNNSGVNALILDNFALAQVPEPSTFALVLLGALGLFGLSRRRPTLINSRRRNP